tara:strand:- start:496 stop:597 length:102 start_codon:yes stop_codon:yes gene_type:complete
MKRKLELFDKIFLAATSLMTVLAGLCSAKMQLT